ncbi:MAG: hypothetical protein OEZ38_03165 [Gammaproteobacteria bacterium]|nr:hypothetical protein [Gammaproteobacteria bacterium]
MRKVTLGLIMLAALLPGTGQTLGLGEIELKSALNQELDAEIEVLSAVAEDAEQLIVKLASRDAFARAGIDRPFFLQQLKFKVLVKNNKPYVKIYTKSAIREPYLSFLVEIDWPEGHMLREYTLLLDPPVYSGMETSGSSVSSDGGRPFIDPADQQYMTQPVSSQQSSSQSLWGDESASAPQVQARPVAPQQNNVQAPQQYQPAPQNRVPVESQVYPAVVETRSASGEVTYRPMPQARPPQPQVRQARVRQVDGTYRVQKHDTLWSIADRSRPNDSVTIKQMMLALVKENPEAFINGNMHGVKRGYILRMPDMNSINRVSRQQAIAEARAHSALWREYRQSMATSTPASALDSDLSSGDTSAKTDLEEIEGKLSIVSASESEGGEADVAGQDPNAEITRLKKQLSMAHESLESERLEKENLQSRLNELEQRVNSVLEMGDVELAKLQSDLQGTRQDVEAAVKSDVVDSQALEMPAADKITDEVVMPDESAMVDMPESTSEVDVGTVTEETALADDVQLPMGEEPLFVDEAQTTEPAAADMSAATPAPAPVMPDTAAPSFVKEQPKTFLEKILNEPNMLAAIGGAILALIVVIGLIVRRKRLNQSASDDDWMPEAAADDMMDLDDATVQMNAMDDMHLDSEKKTNLEPGGDRNLEKTVSSLAGGADTQAEAEQDDVLSEADVYLAYGIYQQAEDLLNSALQQNPDRDDYRMKLLETHYAAKDSAAFASLAEVVKGRKAGDKEYWERVILMGQELCPGNALFEAGDLDVSGLATDDLIPQKPEAADLDLDMGDSLADLGLGDDLDSDATQVLSEPLDLDSSTDELGGLDDLAGFDDELSVDDSSDLTMDSGDLDFDMGELDAGAEETASGDSGLDLDVGDDFALDLDASDLGLEEVADTGSADAEMDLSMDMDATDLGSGDEDMSLDLDSGDGDMSLSLDAGDLSSGDEDMSLDLDTGDDDSLDLSMDFEDSSDEMGLSMDMDSTDLGSGDEDMSLSMDMDTGDDALDLTMDMEAGSDEEISFDMDDDAGEVELDLSMDDSSSDGLSFDAGDDDFDISALSEDVDEIGTKLELARAYLEMGDKDGAMSILGEVKEEGNEAQQKEATELLQQAS